MLIIKETTEIEETPRLGKEEKRKIFLYDRGRGKYIVVEKVAYYDTPLDFDDTGLQGFENMRSVLHLPTIPLLELNIVSGVFEEEKVLTEEEMYSLLVEDEDFTSVRETNRKAVRNSKSSMPEWTISGEIRDITPGETWWETKCYIERYIK